MATTSSPSSALTRTTSNRLGTSVSRRQVKKNDKFVIQFVDCWYSGPHRAKFLHESVVNLRENLRKLNSDLVTEHSRPVDSIRRIFEKCNQLANPVVGVVYQKEVTFEEVEVEKAIKDFCQGQGAKVTELWGSTLYHRQDIPYKNIDSIPNTYTQFRKVQANQTVVRYFPIKSSCRRWSQGAE